MTNHDAYSSFADDEFNALLTQAHEEQIAALDAAWDFEAGLADVYARAGRIETTTTLTPSNTTPAPEPAEEQDDVQPDAVEDVCSHIEMLDVLLATISKIGEGPVLYGSHVMTARQYLMQLRIGLSQRQLNGWYALNLLQLVKHALAEADRAIRLRDGQSLEQTLRDRIGELREINTDLDQQLAILRDKIIRLFNDANDPASLTPIPN
ncbi:hypothetical protein AB0C18_12300 [Nonomuraea muscovyensis]|uniref:hypothetical protein n=1 Tax=Nonomuraea muscovyensis TaxID=1124761 RepID=UPI0034079114